MEKIKKPEKKSEESGVFENNGEFFLYSKDVNDFIKIPKEIYRVIKVALYSEERIARDEINKEKDFLNNLLSSMLIPGFNEQVDINDDYKYEKTKEIHKEFNCHKTLFYPQKNNTQKIEKIKDWKDSESLIVFNDADLKEFDSIEDFKEFIKSKIKPGDFGVSQVIEYIKKNNKRKKKAVHSFFVGIGESGKIIVFEKEGFDFPFAVKKIDEVFEYWNALAEPDYGDGNSVDIKYGVKKYNEFSDYLKK